MTQEPPPDSPIASQEAMPFVHLSPRHNSWTPERQRGFCLALAECGNVDRAAKSVGMSRESAYRLRHRAAGMAFALAWDAALLLARQRLIDDAFEMAFEGSIERHYRDGELVVEKRRRDPSAVLAVIERLGAESALGKAPAIAVGQDFEAFLDCMEADARHQRGEAGKFITRHADHPRHNFQEQASLMITGHQLAQALRRTPRRDER